MAQENEQIEARLAAYVDGLLPESDRAEIELHLANHPEHLAVLHELIRHKEMVVSLPRESAPGDLSEALQGHLERAALLGDQNDAVALGVRRFPQFTALAAMVLLTVGLAIVVYFALPTSKPP